MPLTVQAISGGSKFTNEFVFDRGLNVRIPDLLRQHSNGRPALVFCDTRASTSSAAMQLASESAAQLITGMQLQLLHLKVIFDLLRCALSRPCACDRLSSPFVVSSNCRGASGSSAADYGVRTDNFPWCVPAYLLQGELRGHQRLPKQSPAPCASKRKALCLLSESVLAHARSKHIHTHTQWSRSRPRVAIPSGSAHRVASVCEPGALLPLCNQHVGGGRKLAGISCHHQEHHPGLWTCIRPSLHVFSSLDCESNQTVLHGCRRGQLGRIRQSQDPANGWPRRQARL